MYSIHTNAYWKAHYIHDIRDAKHQANAALQKVFINHVAVVDDNTGEIVYEAKKVHKSSGFEVVPVV